MNDIDKIIKIQSTIRRFLIKQRKSCINIDDFYTLDSKYDIPSKYYFSYIDADGFKYCFDIRSLKRMFELSDKKVNPYNFKPFSPTNVNKIYEYINNLQSQNISTIITPDIVSAEKKFELKVIDVFHLYDALDNYTNHQWFLDLTFPQLRELYKRCKNIWNYRNELPFDAKKRIVKEGKAFEIPLPVIYRFRSSQKRTLQWILINEFERFATEGENAAEKKLGTLLILSALVEVSLDAADALSYLVQIE